MHATRRATATDVPAIAAVHHAAFRAALPHIPELHTPAEALVFFSGVVSSSDVWVAEVGDTVVGFIACRPGWIDHLYVHPDHQRMGIGSQLLSHAKTNARPLQLWTFQRNENAKRFYLRHGFTLDHETDGSGNEEKEPDALFILSEENHR